MHFYSIQHNLHINSYYLFLFVLIRYYFNFCCSLGSASLDFLLNEEYKNWWVVREMPRGLEESWQKRLAGSVFSLTGAVQCSCTARSVFTCTATRVLPRSMSYIVCTGTIFHVIILYSNK